MPLFYPTQTFGRCRLGLGLTYQLVHNLFGVDLGERYHRDLDHRIQTTMEIDRAVFDRYGNIGLASGAVSPGEHRAVWASVHARDVRLRNGIPPDGEPWSKPRGLQ